MARTGFQGQSAEETDGLAHVQVESKMATSVIVAWYHREDEKAGYHIRSNCEIGQSIDNRNIEITSEDDASNDYELSPECELRQEPYSKRPRGVTRCGKITIRTKKLCQFYQFKLSRME